MNIKKGDIVIIKTGKDLGKKGKVLRALPADGKIVVEGVNIKKKRQRPRKSNEKGQVMEMPFPLNTSNALIFCSGCNKGARLGSKIVKGKKVRVCVKCGKEF
ncbi:MAG: 50S ribosomal protein L24 [Candidatus Vogelbacteria bacterium]|nr:50S ribosomal protein L24 [Candidatus Vogelbacteria bacterium]